MLVLDNLFRLANIVSILFVSEVLFATHTAHANLLDVLNQQERGADRAAAECQEKGLMAKFVNTSSTVSGIYFMVNDGNVYRGENCYTGSTSGTPGVLRWDKIGTINEITSRMCNESGVLKEQWSFRGGKLVLVESGENCVDSGYGVIYRTEGTHIKAELRPITWKCKRHFGYNPNNLARDCTY